MMRQFLFAILFLVGWSEVQAQWNIVFEEGESKGHNDLFFVNADTGFVSGYDSVAETGFISRTHDGGETWEYTVVEDHNFRDVYFPSPDTGYVACYYNFHVAVMRTVDGGDSWVRIAEEIAFANGIPYSISFFDNDNGIISIAGISAYTEDAGVNWTHFGEEIFGGYRDSDAKGSNFVAIDGSLLAYSQDGGTTIVLDTLMDYYSHSNVHVRDHRFISSSLGGNGQSIGYPQYSFGIVAKGNTSSEEYNVSHFPERTRVYGLSWPSEEIMYAISVSNTDGVNSPFFIKSIDGGATWYEQETEGPYYGTHRMVCPTDSICYAIGGNLGKIYKTTNGGGDLLDPITQITLSVDKLSKAFYPFTLFPNPSSSSVSIKCDKDLQRVELLDEAGRVLTVFEGKQTQDRVDVSMLAKGVYLIKVETVDGELGLERLMVE